MSRKRRVLAIVFCLLVSLPVFNANALAASVKLNIEGVVQEQSNWCWAATSKSIIDYLKGTNPSQTEIVTSVMGSAVNQGATMAEDTKSLQNFGVHTKELTTPISFAAIKKDIQAKHPIKASIFWNSGGGHDLVIYGFSDDAKTQTVSFMDPWPEDNRWNTRTYKSFVSNSEWKWGWTHYDNY